MDLKSKNKDQSPKRSSTKAATRRREKSGNASGTNQQHQSRSGRCLKPGPILRNPYLNFLREFRKKNCGLTAVETVRQGAKAWNLLSEEQKLHYIKEAFYAPKLKRRRRSLSRKMSASAPSRRSKSRGSSRKSRRRTASMSKRSALSQRAKISRRHSRRRGISC